MPWLAGTSRNKGGVLTGVEASGNGYSAFIKEVTGTRAGLKKPPELKTNYDIEEVHEQYHEIARRLVLGHKAKQIADDLNISIATIQNAKKSPVIQEQLRILGGARDFETKNVARQIRDLAPKCVSVIQGILDDDDVGNAIKLKASLAVLDRAGHSVPKNVNVKGVHAVVTPADLERIKQRATEIGIETGMVVDV